MSYRVIYYDEGYNAFCAGVEIEWCPYVIDSLEGEFWLDGWSNAYSWFNEN